MEKKTLLGIVFTIVALLSFVAVVNDSSFDSDGADTDFFKDKGGGTTDVTYRVVSADDLTASVSTGKDARGTANDPLVIPSKVTSNKDDKEYTVIGLDSKSFQSAKNLHAIKLPDTLTTIGESAFATSDGGTPGLVSIDIPDSVTYIGPGAFSGCVNLEKVKLPKSLTEILNTVFINCGKLQYIEISENVMFINNDAFNGCGLLETVILPESLEGMGEFVFQNCDQLRHISIPKNVRDINWDLTFYGSGLEYVDVSDENPYFMVKNNLVLIKDGQTVVFCPVKAKDATVPEGVKYIGTNTDQYAFRCSDLISVSLPSTLVEMTNRAFGGCSSLKKIELPNSLEVIGDRSFMNCSSLEEIVMSDSLHTIGEFAFAGCSSLKGLTLPKTIKEIGDSAFSSCSSITGMIIPYGTEKIGSGAFWKCTSLVNLEIPDTVTELGSSVFEGCKSLVGVRLPDGIDSVGEKMFNECESLRTVVIPANVRTVGSDVFKNCESLRSVEFPKTFEGFSGAIGVVFYNGNGEQYTDYTSLAGKTFVQGGKDANFKFIFYESYSDDSEGYMVTFRVDGNTYYKEFVKSGEKVVLPQDPAKKKTTGIVYSFTGWNGYTDGMTVTGDTVFNAEFTTSKKVQVQFVERNGNIFDTKEHTYGTTFSYPAGKPDGYVSYGEMYAFKDWEWYSEDDVTGLMKYKAVYSKVSGYFVKFDAAGGTGSMDRIFVKAGESATLPENAFTRSGYTFGGWTDGKSTYADKGTIPASDRNTDLPLTLDAVWNGEKYRLTVNYIGPVRDGAFRAPAAHTEMIAKGGSFSLTPPAVDHYKASREYVSGTMPGSDVTINVYYKSDTYNIEYGTNLNGILTKVIPKTTYSYTSEYVLPVVDRVTQWYSDEAKTYPVEKISKFSTGDKKFWCDVMENKVTVKFVYSTNYQDENYVVGTMEPVVVDSGAMFTFPQSGFTYEGYTFVCWFDRGYEYHPGDSRNIYTDTSFYAKWKKVEYNLSVTLAGPTESFDFGDNPTSFTGKKEWGTVELYTLEFRDITVDGKTYAPEIEKFYMPAEDTTLTVHYYEKYAAGAKKSIEYNSELSVYLPAKNFTSFATHRGTVTLDDLAYDGYRFDGWYSDKERTIKIDKVDLNVSGNQIKVYAKWTPLEYDLKVVYTGPDDGRFQAPADHVEKVKTNDTYRVVSPAVEGYAPVIKYLEGKMGSANTTVEVQYVPTEWNIRYYTNGGDNAIDSIPDYTMTQSVTYKMPTREGYTFNGWYSDPELTTKVDGISEGNTKFVRVYASWTSESGGTVTVNFVGPDANFTAPAKIERHYAAGERYSIDVPSVTGYTPDRPKVEDTMGTDDVTITVTYSANQHNVRIKTGQTDITTPVGWTKVSDGVFVRTFGYNSQITLPELSREGYTFRWSPDVPASMPDTDLEFEAVWFGTEMSRELVINYVGPSGDKDFHAPNEIRVKVRTGQSYEYRSPTVEGYVPDLEAVKGVMSDRDISVTVTYSVKKVTVTFLPNNGERVWSVTTDYNGTVAQPEAPAWDGHTFIGWFSKGAMYGFGTPVKDDINLTAEWNSESGEFYIVHTEGQVEFNIPSTGSTNTNIIIELPNDVNISFGSDTIQSASGSNIQASMTELDGEKFEITVNKNGVTMNGAPMDISLPFTPGKGTPLVYYYPDSGDRILMGGEVDKGSSTIKFRTTHNSVYGIVYTTPTDPGDDSGDDNIFVKKSSKGLDRNESIAIIAATIVGALALLTIAVRRK